MLRAARFVLVLALMVSVIAAGPVVAAHAAQNGTPAATPSISAPTTETLLDTTTDALPTGRAVIAVDRFRLQPSATPLILPPRGGVTIFTVTSGELTATEGGTDHPLAVGDTFTPGAEEVAFRVSGSDEVTMFAVYAIAGFEETGVWEHDPIAHQVDFLISTSTDALPGGSARVVLERLTVPPGSVLPPQDVTPLVWTEIGEGAVGMTLEGEQLPFRWKSGAERTFRHGQYLPALQPGTRMTLRNVEDDQLVLYRLTLTPMGGSAATAGTAIAATPAP